MDHIVVDVEIARTIDETPGGWDATDRLGISAACVWEYQTQRMRIYGPEDVSVLQERLLRADRISGFNIWKFDFPVIWGYSRQEWTALEKKTACVRYALLSRTDNLLRRIWQALNLNPDEFTDRHKGWGLDAVTRSTLNAGKIGHGAEAPKWYQAGQVHRVINYCADDVALERDLCDFVDRHGYVLNNGRQLMIPPWQPDNFSGKSSIEVGVNKLRHRRWRTASPCTVSMIGGLLDAVDQRIRLVRAGVSPASLNRWNGEEAWHDRHGASRYALERDRGERLPGVCSEYGEQELPWRADAGMGCSSAADPDSMGGCGPSGSCLDRRLDEQLPDESRWTGWLATAIREEK